MRALMIALAVGTALATIPASAHGPQIQIARDNDKITTRRLLREEPYAASLTPATRVYVIPLLETGGEWYSRPNNTPSNTLPGQPVYLSGPGIAYGYDQVDGGPREFASGQHFELNLINGLKWWNGSAFIDPGLEQVEAFRSSGSPAVTNDSLTPGSPSTLNYSNLSTSSPYGAEAHSGASFRLLGDGMSGTAPSDDGVYLASMSYGSSEVGLNDSEPFFFVLHKNVLGANVAAAVDNLAASLNLSSSLVQYVPEPGSTTLLIGGAVFVALRRRRRTSGRLAGHDV